MSAKHRCHTCGHRPGPRKTGNISKQGSVNPSKKSCGCDCHTREGGGE